MKMKRISILTIVLVCFSLYFLVNTINIYNVEKRTLISIDERIIPDSLIYNSENILIENPELRKYEIERDLDFELLGMARNQLRENRNILLVFVFLTILSFKIFLLEKKKEYHS